MMCCGNIVLVNSSSKKVVTIHQTTLRLLEKSPTHSLRSRDPIPPQRHCFVFRHVCKKRRRLFGFSPGRPQSAYKDDGPWNKRRVDAQR